MVLRGEIQQILSLCKNINLYIKAYVSYISFIFLVYIALFEVMHRGGWVIDMHVDGFRFDLASALCRGLAEGSLSPKILQ